MSRLPAGDDLIELQRREVRVPVQFHCTHAVVGQPQETALLLDLSWGGCRMYGAHAFLPGVPLMVRVDVPSQLQPLFIDEAEVRWSQGLEFGLRFRALQPREQARLRTILQERLIPPAPASQVLYVVTCPTCRREARRMPRFGWGDRLRRLIGLYPYRCLTCGRRFYRFRRH